MLIDDALGFYEIAERHHVAVAASPDVTFAAVQNLDLARDPMVRLLLRMRGLPAGASTWEGLVRLGFVELGVDPGRELLMGVVGRFWKPKGDIIRLDAAAFRDFAEPGYAKAVWNYAVEPGPAELELATETRVACTDPSVRPAFRRYWRVVGPFSGLIRRRTLRLIKGAAEAA